MLRQFPWKVYQTFKELTLILYNLFQKKEEEGTFPNSFYEALKPKPDKDDTKKEKKKQKQLQTNILMNLDTKFLNKILANSVEQYFKIIMHHQQWDIFQGYKSVQCLKINQYNPTYQQAKKENSHDHIN